MTEEMREFLEYMKNPKTVTLHSSKIKELDERVQKVKSDMEVRDKYMTVQNWLAEQIDIGIKAGIEEAVQEALEETRVEALEEGELKTKIDFIYSKYQKGYNAEKISEILELDKDFVASICGLFEQHPSCDSKEIAKIYSKIK